MPPVDASYEPGSANSFAKYYQDSAFNRNKLAADERANKLGDLQYQQELDKENQARALKSYFANKNPNDPDFNQGLGMIVGPQGVANYEKQQLEAKKSKLGLRVQQDEFTDKLKKNLSRNPSDENVIAWGQDAVIDGLFTQEQAEANTRELLAMPPEERKKYLAGESDQPDPAEVATMRRLGFPMTPEGYAQYRDMQRADRLLSPEEEAQKIRIAGARPPTEPTPAAPVAVVDPRDPTKIVLVDRKRAIDEGLTPANAQSEGLAPKEILARNARYPAQTQAIKAFEAQSNSFLGDMTKLLNHPGLSGMTGFIAGRTPNLTGAAREAQALYDKIVAKGGFSVLQAIREASKTGGALGNLSNQEGTQLKAAFAAIKETQDTESIQRALEQAISELEGAKVRMREAYDSTYEYKNTGRGAGVDGSNPLLK